MHARSAFALFVFAHLSVLCPAKETELSVKVEHAIQLVGKTGVNAALVPSKIFIFSA